MEALKIIIAKDIQQEMSKLNNINEDIERYWKEALQNHMEENEEVTLCDTLTELIDDHTKDKDDIAEEIFQLLFNSDDISYWMEMDTSDIFPSDMLRMVEYFNTYYEENFGVECCVYKKLTEQTVYLHYALTYAMENGIQDKIREWLDENMNTVAEQ
jgi:hypothetical protein